MPTPIKKYHVTLGNESQVWADDRFERNREQLYQDHPDVQVYEIGDEFNNEYEDTDPDSHYFVQVGKEFQVWDADKFDRNRRQLFVDHPNAKISKAKVYQRPVEQDPENYNFEDEPVPGKKETPNSRYIQAIRKAQQGSPSMPQGNIRRDEDPALAAINPARITEKLNRESRVRSEDEVVNAELAMLRYKQLASSMGPLTKEQQDELTQLEGIIRDFSNTTPDKAVDFDEAVSKMDQELKSKIESRESNMGPQNEGFSKRTEALKELYELTPSAQRERMEKNYATLNEQAREYSKKADELYREIESQLPSKSRVFPLVDANGLEMTDVEAEMDDQFAFLKNPEILRYRAAADQLKEGWKIFDAYQKDQQGKNWTNFWEGFGEGFMNELMSVTKGRYGQAVIDLGNSIQGVLNSLPDTASSVDIDKAIKEKLSPGALALLDAYNTNAAIAAAYDPGTMYNAGTSAGASTEYMAEFILGSLMTGGIQGAVKQGAKGLFKAWLKKEIKNKAANYVVKKGIGVLAADLGAIAAGGAQTLVSPGTYNAMIQAKAQLGKHGELVGTDADMYKAGLMRWLENSTEFGLGPFNKVIGEASGLIRRYAPELRFGEYLPGIKKIFDAAAIKQVPEEWGEELNNAVINYILGLDENAMEDFFTGENQLMLLTSFAPTMGSGMAISAGGRLYQQRKYKAAENNLRDELKDAGYNDETIENLIRNINGSTPKELADNSREFLHQVYRDNKGNEDLLKVFGHYVQRTADMNTLRAGEDRIESEKRQAMLDEMEGQIGKFYTESGKGDIRTARRILLDKEATERLGQLHGDVNEVYVVGEDATNYAVLLPDGTKQILPKEKVDALIAEGFAHDSRVYDETGGYRDVTLEEILDAKLSERRNGEEQQRMAEDANAAEQQFQQEVANNAVITIGGPDEAPQQLIVRGFDPATGEYILYPLMASEDGGVEEGVDPIRMSKEQLAEKMNISLEPKTDEQLAEDEAAQIEAAHERVKAYNDRFQRKTEADPYATVTAMQELDGETPTPVPYQFVRAEYSDDYGGVVIVVRNEEGEEVEFPEESFPDLLQQAQDERIIEPGAAPEEAAADGVPRDSMGNRLPMTTDEDGNEVVDQAELWMQNPKEWCIWNDANPGVTGVSSEEKLTYRIASLDGRIAELEAAKKQAVLDNAPTAEVNKIAKEAATLAAKRQEYQGILDDYKARAAAQAAQPEGPAFSRRGVASIRRQAKQKAALQQEGPAFSSRGAEQAEATPAQQQPQAESALATPLEADAVSTPMDARTAEALDQWAAHAQEEANKAIAEAGTDEEARAAAMQSYLNTIASPDAPAVVSTKKGIADVMREAGCSEADVWAVVVETLLTDSTNDYYRSQGEEEKATGKVEGFYAGRQIFVLSDYMTETVDPDGTVLSPAEEVRSTYVHERQHMRTAQNGLTGKLDAALGGVEGVSTATLRSWVKALSGVNYKGGRQRMLDELVSMTMQRAYAVGSEGIEENLRSLGIDNENLINFVKTLYDEQSNNSSLALARRPSHVSYTPAGSVREDGRDSAGVPGGNVGRQGGRAADAGNEGAGDSLKGEPSEETIEPVEEEVSFSLSAQSSKRYSSALSGGSLTEAADAVRRAAAEAMPNTVAVDEDGLPKKVYHDTSSKVYINKETGEDWDLLGWEEREKWEARDDWDEHWEERDFTVFDQRRARTSIEMPAFFFAPEEDPYHEYGDRTIEAYINLTNPAINPEIPDAGVYNDSGMKAMQDLIAKGYDGFIRTDEDGNVYEYGVFNSNQIKSADPVTYDDKGNIIPLEHRMDPASDDIRFSLIGEKGAERLFMYEQYNQMHLNLLTAKEMEKAGKDADAIYLATGWQRGVDGKWRVEVPDIQAKQNLQLFISPNNDYRLLKECVVAGEAMDRLETAYPGIGDIRVYSIQSSLNNMSERTIAHYNSDRDEIVFNADRMWGFTNDEMTSHLLHELQHAIQYREGFARGGNTEDPELAAYGSIAELNEQANKDKLTYFAAKRENPTLRFVTAAIRGDKVPDDVKQAAMDRLGQVAPAWERLYNKPVAARVSDGPEMKTAQKAAKMIEQSICSTDLKEMVDKAAASIEALTAEKMRIYRSLAGEVEARNVQTRANLSEGARSVFPFSETEDVLRANQIVRASLLRPALSEEAAGDYDTRAQGQHDAARSLPSHVDEFLLKESPEESVSFSLVSDKAEIERLEAEPKVNGGKLYRAMLYINGRLYPPMSAKEPVTMISKKGNPYTRWIWRNPTEFGSWYRSDERPDLVDEDGNFTLNKGNGDSIKAAYNPYFHTSNSPLNDQFTSAYKRPNLVVVEVEVPESELTSGYKADKAKDAVGEMDWHKGPVASKYPEGSERKVVLSRWCKVKRIVPDAEVAAMVAPMLKEQGISVPYNVITPSMREALEAEGVTVSDEPSGTVEAVDEVSSAISKERDEISRLQGLQENLGLDYSEEIAEREDRIALTEMEAALAEQPAEEPSQEQRELDAYMAEIRAEAEGRKVEDDLIRFSLTRRNRETIEKWLDKREGLTPEQKQVAIDYIEKMDDPKLQLATARWYAGGVIRIPEDMPKVEQAVDVAGKAKVDPLQYDSPMALLEAHADFKPSEKRIDPDTVPTLHRIKDYPRYGVTVYQVDESDESRQNMREIINTHFGKDASPWCLLQGDGNGNLTGASKSYWNHYNGYPKMVAFQNGKLLSFSANDGSNVLWWDRMDQSHNGIPVTMQIEGDELGRSATYEIDEDGLLSEPMNIFKGNRQNGTYEEWDKADGSVIIHEEFKDGKPSGEFRHHYFDGTLQWQAIYQDGHIVGEEYFFDEKGNMRERITHDDYGNTIRDEEWYGDGQRKSFHENISSYAKGEGIIEWWYENGQKSSETHYLDGKRHGSMKRWTHAGTLKESANYKNGAQDGLQEIYYDNGALAMRINMKDGHREGLYESFYSNGDPECFANYKNGAYDGECRWWHRGNLPSRVENYLWGRREGESRMYYINGVLEMTVPYTLGMKDGVQKEYRADGTLASASSWKGGVLQGIGLIYSFDGETVNLFRIWEDDRNIRDLDASHYGFEEAERIAREEYGVEPGEAFEEFRKGVQFSLTGAANVADRYEYQDGSAEFPWMSERDLFDAISREIPRTDDTKPLYDLIDRWNELDGEDLAEGRRDFAGGQKEEVFNEILSELDRLAADQREMNREYDAYMEDIHAEAEGRDDDILFSLSRRNRETIEKWLDKREGLTPEEKQAAIDYIEKMDDPKLQLATARWYAGGAIRIPEDMPKVEQAVDVAGKAKVDPLQYDSPMALLDANADFKPSEKRIDPDSVPTLHRKNEVPEYGIVIYDVDNSDESRQNMREIINTHFGKDASPWCLLQGDGKGNLTETSKRYWIKYSAYPKMVAFRNGKLLAFSANNYNRVVWWDRKDESHNGLLIDKKLDDGRTADYTLDPITGDLSTLPEKIYRGNEKDGLYEEWRPSGDLRIRRTRKDGVTVGPFEIYHKNGKPFHIGQFNDSGNSVGEDLWYNDDGSLDSKYIHTEDGRHVSTERYHKNGRLRESVFFDEDGKLHGLSRSWFANGRLKTSVNYVHGKIEGEELGKDGRGRLEYRRHWKDGKPDGIHEFYSKGQLVEATHYVNGKKDGLQTIYYGEGSRQEYQYKNDRYDGVARKWIKGVITEEIQYKDGFKDGVDLGYRNGKKGYEYRYKEGVQHGLQKWYLGDGSLLRAEIRRNGKIVADLENVTEEEAERIARDEYGFEPPAPLLSAGDPEAEQRLTDAGAFADGDEVRFSARYTPTDPEALKQYAKDIAKDLGVSERKAERYLKSETSLTSIILDPMYSDQLDYKPDDRYHAIKQNSDYQQGTVDFNNICRKRIAFTALYQRLQKDFPYTVITGEDLANIRQIMMDHGMTVACGLCYVEDRRQLLGEIAQEFIDELGGNFENYANGPEGTKTKQRNAARLRELLGEDRKEGLSIYDLITLTGAAKLSEEHPGIYNAFVQFNKYRGQQAGRLFEGYAEYKREILNWNRAKVRGVNNAGGLRIFSYSDFEAHHLIDLVQIIIDCARKGIKIQGYTKVPSFARAVAQTGVKLNRSLIPLGDTGIKDGKLAYDTVEGIDINDPDFLESNDNVGNILVGINDEQIRLAMADPFVHYIIPFHTNQSMKVRNLKQTGAWTNYKNYQEDKSLVPLPKGKTVTGVNIYTDVLAEAEKDGTPIRTERQFVERFLAECKERKLKPRFWNFINTNSKGEYVYTPGYYKLLLDFKLFDENGRILPQKPVVPVFDDEFNAKILKEYAEGEQTKDIEAESAAMDEVYDEVLKALRLEDRGDITSAAKDVMKKMGLPAQEEVRFSLSNQSNAVFVSNAEKAAEGIKQEKATPEQWKAMLQKAGGLKSGEDKWIGLSDWLDEQANPVSFDDYWDRTKVEWTPVEDASFKEPVLDKAQFTHGGRFDSAGYKRKLDYLRGRAAESAERSVREKWAEMRKPGLEYKKSPYRSSNSEYLVDRENGLIYRFSDHWGEVGQCVWPLKEADDKSVAIAVAPIKDFKRLPVTKQQVLDYIREHRIDIEEVHYEDLDSSPALRELQEEFDSIPFYDPEAMWREADDRLREFYDAMYDKYGENYLDEMNLSEQAAEEQLMEDREHWEENDKLDEERAYDAMVDKYGDDFRLAFNVEGGRLYITDPDAAGYFLSRNPIDDTRQRYQTKGLENNHEIALTVPSIEPYEGALPKIHFADDLTEGKTVAWIRFGDAQLFPVTDENAAAQKALEDYLDSMYDKYHITKTSGSISDLLPNMTPDERNEFHRLRDAVNDTRSAGAKKVLFIDEIQSQRHQDAREKGGYRDKDLYSPWQRAIEEFITFKDAMADKYDVPFGLGSYDFGYQLVQKGASKEDMDQYQLLFNIQWEAQREYEEGSNIPAAPFEKNWHELAFKRMLRYAAENGYDVIAWTTGAQQAERYNIGSVLQSVDKTGENNFTLYLTGGTSTDIEVDNDGVITGTDAFSREWEGKKLSEVVGKELAVRMMTMEVDSDDLDHIDTLIGAEGMNTFYDQILPNFVNKYGKKWGVKVENQHIPGIGQDGAGVTAHTIPVTEEMKESVMDGQPMFSLKNDSSDETYAENRRTIDVRYGSYMSDALLNSVKTGVWTPDTVDEFNNLLEQIKDGKYIYQRTAQERDPYSSSCTEAHVGASIIIRGKDTTSEALRRNQGTEYAREAAEGKEQERLIEAWAKANNLWFNDYTDPEGNKAQSLEELVNSQWRFWRQGTESDVHVYDEDTTLKVINLSHYNDNPGLLLDSIALFNRLFPGVSLDVVGFGRDSLGHFKVIALQGFVEGEELTDDELDKAIGSLPVKLIDKGAWYETEDGLANLTDLAEYNILKDKDGNYFVIDCDIVYNTPDRGGDVTIVDEIKGNPSFSLRGPAVTTAEEVEDRGIEAVIGAGARQDFYKDLYFAVPDDIRREIVGNAINSAAGPYDVLKNYIAGVAAAGYESDETGILRFTANAMRGRSDNPDSISDEFARYILWNEGNRLDEDDIVSIASHAAMKRRFGVEDDGVRFAIRGHGRDERLPGGYREEGGVVSPEAVRESIERNSKAVAKQVSDAKAYFDEKRKVLSGTLRGAVALIAQKGYYDKATVKAVTDAATAFLREQDITELNRRELNRILSLVKHSAGASPYMVRKNMSALLSAMVDPILRTEKARLDQILARRTEKTNKAGIQVMDKLDIHGQRILRALHEGIERMSLGELGGDTRYPSIEEAIADAIEKSASEDKAVADEAKERLIGLNIAKMYHEGIAASEADEYTLDSELDAVSELYRDGKYTQKEYRELVAELEAKRSEIRLDRIETYRLISGLAEDFIAGSQDAALLFREEQEERMREIYRDIARDMQGQSAAAERSSSWWKDRVVNGPITRFVGSMLPTFDQMLRYFGKGSIDGDGWLHRRFMNLWHDATDAEIEGREREHKILDDKVSEVFGKKMRWSDLYSIDRRMPKATVTWLTADGERKSFTLTQGNLLYIYMVNKMTDGRMKLREMGITEEDVKKIKDQMDPRFIKLADWLQEDYLVKSRNRYNDLHIRLFGAPMAAVENYFPLRINQNARFKEQDTSAGPDTDGKLPTDATGAIVKRRVNRLPLDLQNANAFSVALEHVDEMEKWAAFAEFNRDVKTMLSNTRFRNQVENMSTIYGSGKALWKAFVNASQLAAGTYQSDSSEIDKVAMNIAKGQTAAAISLRLYTAMKQILSHPAFVADTNPAYLAKATATPWASWNWGMKNLPQLRERFGSRFAGDTRLLKSEKDWWLFRTRIYDELSKIGMSPNAFIDALTCSIGAKAVYDTKLRQYLKDGFDRETAEKKAHRDASTAFNSTQQSSQGAFVSPVQMDRTVMSAIVTTFRNSSAGYQRQLVDAIRNERKLLTPGYRARSIEQMKRQMMEDGLTEEQAEHAAKRRYNREIIHTQSRIATFGFLVQFAWNLGSHLFYLLFGDDDDKKKGMIEEDAIHALLGGPIEGLGGGQYISELANMIATDQKLSNYDPFQLPFASELKKIIHEFDSDEMIAWNDLIGLAVTTGLGVNPKTLTDIVAGVVEASEGNLDVAKEALLLAGTILSVPKSQMNQLYLDELDMPAGEARKLKYGELANRWAHKMLQQNSALSSWAYSDEDERKREDAYLKKFNSIAKERFGSDETKAMAEDVTRGVNYRENLRKADASGDPYKSARVIYNDIKTRLEEAKGDEKREIIESPNYQIYVIIDKHEKRRSELQRDLNKAEKSGNTELAANIQASLDALMETIRKELNELK